MKEIWKDIDGYEGLYQISNYGRVKSLEKFHSMRIDGNVGFYEKEKILRSIMGNKGYYVISLVKNKTKKQIRIHRLVAQAFIPNPNNLPQVNHIDGNKRNNRVDNLEWCTSQHNIKESWRLGLSVPTKPMLGRKSERCPNSIKVDQYTLDGVFIKTWNCGYDAIKELNLRSNHISDCCNNKRKSFAGFVWKYTKEEDQYDV